ncbi:MAG TPA: ATP--cob(I)alamin adenosyltransferase [Clostridiaceae bacterium]|nr:ATP--cob(I)alamin adenosyltransferase [Clostridiaceae bacterium]
MDKRRGVYRSKYEAYPFLADDADDLICDFEIFTDLIASKTGLLRAIVNDRKLKEELLKICELIYHINPSLRTKVTVTQEELMWLEECTKRLHSEVGDRCKRFVVTQGSQAACQAHVLRVQCKALVRMLYRVAYSGKEVEPILFDFANLLSGYFFLLALKLNALDGVEEIDYVSRNY